MNGGQGRTAASSAYSSSLSRFLSPYHLAQEAEEEETQHMRELEQQLLSSSAATAGSHASADADGLLFHYIAEALDTSDKSTEPKRINLVSGLVNHALAHPTHPTLQVLALLRVLMPSRDSRSVYGFKTTSLIRSFARAFEKEGGVYGQRAAQEILQSLKRPLPEQKGKGLITTPEVVIARAHGRCFSSSSLVRKRGLTLIEVAALCQQLTNTYKERHKQAVLTLTTQMGGRAGMSVHIDSVAEILGTVLSRLSYEECKVLVRLLLRTVPMGIGPGTVLKALGPNLDCFMEMQQDLGRLAIAIVKHQQSDIRPQLVCGVPMTPMTCHSTSSPYLMKWLFTKQDTVKQYLSPKLGQLIIHSLGPWYVPTKSSGTTAIRNRFVDLESPGAIQTKHRRQHMLVLREIRRHTPAVFRTEMARGYLIRYMLYVEEQTGAYVMLLQGVQPLSYTRVEFADASVVLDDPKQEDAEEEEAQAEVEEDDEDEDVDFGAKKKKSKQQRAVAKQKKKKDTTIPRRMEPKRIQEILKSMLSDTKSSSGVENNNSSNSNGLQTPIGLVRIVTMPDAQGNDNNNNEKKSQTQPQQQQQQGMMVQRKMDGDRMQAHIMQDSKGNSVVRLFTKRGRPVHGLYTDVANELKQVVMVSEQPCILDGEIVVVDPETNKPLPWSSTKWRYDSSGKAAKRLSELTQSEQKGIITLVDGTEAYGYNTADEEDSLTFAPNASALMHWSDMGASERTRLKVKTLPRGKLLFIVFDVLMHRGVPLASKTCRHRLETLKAMPSLKRRNLLKHVAVIEESWYVKNAAELVERLRYIVKEKGEGLILKNPDARYEFTRSMHQRKLKICGPDINCGVVGLGFTFSRNPRQWGLLTCIRSSTSAARGLLLVYNRVETIEGDRVKTAAEHILGLQSLVSLHEVLHNSSSEKPIRSGKYKVFCTQLQSHTPKKTKSATPTLPTMFSVTWLATGEERCTLYFLHGVPKDIQWLCNPFDCRFGLSQRGDIYPVDWQGDRGDEEELRASMTTGDQPTSTTSSSSSIIIQVPRFPVGRIQLDDHQRSEMDTPVTVVEKFTAAADESTCLEGFLTRKIRHLRTKPPHPKKLEELRRILTAMEDPMEVWPKVCPATYYLKDFSQMLEKHGHKALSLGERLVLSGITKASQWDPLRIRGIPLVTVRKEEEEDMQGRFEASKGRLVDRMNQLKQKMKRTILMTRGFARTGDNFLDSVLMLESSTTTPNTTTSNDSSSSSPSEPAKGPECFSLAWATDNHDTTTRAMGGHDSTQATEDEDDEDEDEDEDEDGEPWHSFCMGEGEEEETAYYPSDTHAPDYDFSRSHPHPADGYMMYVDPHAVEEQPQHASQFPYQYNSSSSTYQGWEYRNAEEEAAAAADGDGAAYHKWPMMMHMDYAEDNLAHAAYDNNIPPTPSSMYLPSTAFPCE